jgi:hypothetical protein
VFFLAASARSDHRKKGFNMRTLGNLDFVSTVVVTCGLFTQSSAGALDYHERGISGYEIKA